MFRARHLVLLLAVPLLADKLTFDQRVEILRGMTAEYATVKTYLPRSKKPLEFKASGEFDKKQWEETGKQLGPAARVGDLVQITKVDIDDERIVLEINGGMKGKRKWYERLEVGMGNSTRPIGTNGQTAAPGGTTLALMFEKKTPPIEASEIKKLLAPILDFEKRTATEQLIDTLPPEIAEAVKEQRAIEGMDRDQVLLALGKPKSKVREVKEGLETEDWIYGHPPGKMTFVTFANGKVLKVKDTYAGLGGQTAPPLKPQL